MSKISTCLWFDGTAEAAARFHVGLIPGPQIESVAGATADGAPLMVNFHLAGLPCQAMDGGPHYPLGPAASIRVITEDQDETDRLWTALITGGGADPAGMARATEAMLTMTRIDIASLDAACRG
jgi:predicted 3-demethylubiquinone-9 3-methyltransferase (glyoxalase superfamily)